jgi:nicotinic acetylcholine receptor, invertebrate
MAFFLFIKTKQNIYLKMQGEWKYIGLVIDRLLLITYLLITIFGTILIIFNAPHIFQFVDQQQILKDIIKKNKES